MIEEVLTVAGGRVTVLGWAGLTSAQLGSARLTTTKAKIQIHSHIPLAFYSFNEAFGQGCKLQQTGVL